MTETERILRAMAAIEEFTVADLVLACDAHAATVRTVLQRHKEDLEELPGTRETGRRGGRWKRYRMLPGAISALAGDVDNESIEADGVPSGLLAVEELLLPEQVATANPSTLASLLRRASRFRDSAVSAGVPSTPAALAHRHVADALITLTKGEIARDAGALVMTRSQLECAREELSHTDKELIDAVEHRLASSPLGKARPYEHSGSALGESRVSEWKDWLGQVVELVSRFAQTIPREALPGVDHGQKGFDYGQKSVVYARGRFEYGRERSRPTGQSLAAEARGRAHRTVFDDFVWASDSTPELPKPDDIRSVAAGRQLASGYEVLLPLDRPTYGLDVGYGASNQRPDLRAEWQSSPPSNLGLQP
jgi:hypothetical protein